MKNSSTLAKKEIRKIGIISENTDKNLFISLADKGLCSLTDTKIEHIMCTSSLAAFN